MCWARNAGSVLVGLLPFVLCRKLQETETTSQTCLGFLGAVLIPSWLAWCGQKQESGSQVLSG